MKGHFVTYLNITQVAKHLGVSQKTVYRLIDKGEIPAVKVGRQWRFNTLDLENWLKGRKSEVNVLEYVDGFLSNIESRLLIYNLLKNDGIFFGIPGKSRQEMLENAINIVNPEPRIDRKELLTNIIDREKLCSTGIGYGIALPHPRHPHNFVFSHSRVFLCFLANKIDFGAIDHMPVDKLFLVFARTIKEHFTYIAGFGQTVSGKRFSFGFWTLLKISGIF